MSSLQSFPHNQFNQSLAQHQNSTANHIASQPHSHAIDSSQSFHTEQDIGPQNDLVDPYYFESDHDDSRHTEQNDAYLQNGIQNRQSNTSTQPTERGSLFSHHQQLSNASSNTTAPSFGKHISQTSLPGAQLPNEPTIQEQDTLAEEDETPQASGAAAGLVTPAAETTTPAGSTRQRPMNEQAWCPIEFDRCKRCKLKYLINSHLHTHREGDPTAVRHACSLCDRSPFDSFDSYMAHSKNHVSKVRDVDYPGGCISGDEYVTNMNNMDRAITRQLMNLLRCSDLIETWCRVFSARIMPSDLLWDSTDQVLNLRDELCGVLREDRQTMERIMNGLINTLRPLPALIGTQPQVNDQPDVSQPTPSTFQQQNSTPAHSLNPLPQDFQQILDSELSQPYPPAALAQPYSPAAYDYAADPLTDVYQQPSLPHAAEAHQEIDHHFEFAHKLQYPAWPSPAHSQDLKPWPPRVDSLPAGGVNTEAQQHPSAGSGSGHQAPSANDTNYSNVSAFGQQANVALNPIQKLYKKISKHNVPPPPPVPTDDAMDKRPRSSKSSHRSPSIFRRPRHE